MRILYSVPHGPLTSPREYVSTPDGLTEPQNAYNVAGYLKPELERLGHECEVLTGSPVSNWYHIEQVRKQEPWALAVELHMNSSTNPHAYYGHLMEYHRGESHEFDLCKRIAKGLVDAMSWSNLIGYIEQPGSPGYGFPYFLRNCSTPSILLEAGFVQDARWASWATKPINQNKLALCLAAAIDEWSRVEPIPVEKLYLPVEPIPVGGLVQK